MRISVRDDHAGAVLGNGPPLLTSRPHPIDELRTIRPRYMTQLLCRFESHVTHCAHHRPIPMHLVNATARYVYIAQSMSSLLTIVQQDKGASADEPRSRTRSGASRPRVLFTMHVVHPSSMCILNTGTSPSVRSSATYPLDSRWLREPTR